MLAAYLHPNVVSHSFMDSLMRVWDHDRANPLQLLVGRLAVGCGPGALVACRNDAVTTWLDETAADWLWLVDSDMGFGDDVVSRLVAAADPVLRPVVGALCYGLAPSVADGMGGWHVDVFPTLYDWRLDDSGDEGYVGRREFPPDQLVPVDATGAACLLLHRDVAAKLRADCGEHWFDPLPSPNGQTLSEDLSLCRRLNLARVPIHVHTGIRTSHHKSVWLQ